MSRVFNLIGTRKINWFDVVLVLFTALFTLLLGMNVLDVFHHDLSVPLFYNFGDAAWQLSLTKLLRDTGWILTNPFLGAPDVAHLHQNSAAQTSALHSVIMLGMSYFIDDAVKIQQIYYLLNFPIIALTSYLTCRLLKLHPVAAAAVGIIFAFTTFRFNYIIYAFLPNYATIPLAILPVIWVGLGDFARRTIASQDVEASTGTVHRRFPRWQFLGGLLCVVLVTASDGYYAFFTLLLLGVATAIRMLSGDALKPIALAAPLSFIAVLVGTSFLLGLPLTRYQANNHHEFYVDGTLDPTLVKHPFESEVYSSSLKLLLSPIANHRIPILGEIGHKIIQTSEAARKYQLGDHSGVQLGTLGALIFVAVLIYLMTPALRTEGHASRKLGWLAGDRFVNLLVSLILFVFLCSIVGGIGSLVGLVFPTIRAYSRFPLFLIFLLLLLAGHVSTRLIDSAAHARRKWIFAGIAIIVGVSLYDQIPRVADNIDEKKLQSFIAERNFVSHIESVLPPGAMVYQYPYSDYLIMSKYYGWGSFAGQRLYIHSKSLHWSGGGAKNSYVENWDLRIAQLPVSGLLNEIGGVGFAAMVIDRTVVGDAEFAQLVQGFAARGVTVSDDPASHFAFARFNDNGFRFEYEPNYINASRLVITDRKKLNMSALPDLVDRTALADFLSRQSADQQYFALDRASHQNLFLDGMAQMRGGGEARLPSDAGLKGAINCSLVHSQNGNSGTIAIDLQNKSEFDWKLGVGQYPLSIGVHLVDANGTQLRWDDGTRIPPLNTHGMFGSGTEVIKAESSREFNFPISALNTDGLQAAGTKFDAVFEVVQDGNAWFKDVSCKVSLSK